MAGHSKWKNIRIRKGKQDAIRGKIFTKLSREIIIAARMGGGDPGTNARLRLAIQKARDNSVPMDNIKRSIQRGTGEIAGADYDQIVYEGYGPGGSAIIAECYTENRNRTVAELRHAFSKSGGNLAENGSVSWQFKYVGEIVLKPTKQSEDDVTMAALEAGADDVEYEEGEVTIYTAMENLHTVTDQLEKSGYEIEDAGLKYIPTNKTELSQEDAVKLIRLLDVLEEMDDIQDTYVNVDITEEMLQEA